MVGCLDLDLDRFCSLPLPILAVSLIGNAIHSVSLTMLIATSQQQSHQRRSVSQGSYRTKYAPPLGDMTLGSSSCIMWHIFIAHCLGGVHKG